MDERSWWDLWNTSYRAEDNRDENSNQLFGHVVDVMRRAMEGKPGRVLEVACGTGTLSRRLSFSSYHGLDLSAAAIEIARQRAKAVNLESGMSRPTYEAADFHDWPLPPEPFDLVLCVDAISCFRDQASTLRKMSGGLRRGGVIILTTVNPFAYERIRRADGGSVLNGPVSHWLSRGELHQLVRQADLRLEDSYTIMPRGSVGILRVLNGPQLNRMLGVGGSTFLRRAQESIGWGQYRVVVARKPL
jgi:2-polyprenyl-3-methyl-5-hydroxy-6-metoxy-1,4-benzoquinol methylase